VLKIKKIIYGVLVVIITVFLGQYVSQLLFSGKNSLKVYNALKRQKNYLEHSIKKIQLENAKLQKEYFELKNLEPEQ
jgi:cell division protein FtsB